MPRPPITHDGRTMTGSPPRPAIEARSSSASAASEPRGPSSPSSTSRPAKRSRSSVISIASAVSPAIGTSAYARSLARSIAVWPPNVSTTAGGVPVSARSWSMTSSTDSVSSGSK